MEEIPELYYGFDGRPISRDEWAQLTEAKYEDRRVHADGWSTPADDPTRVGLDRVRGQTVSTVWLGLNHSFGHGPPLIFETMVFGGPHDQRQMWRYPTWEAARAGHDRVVAALRAGRAP